MKFMGHAIHPLLIVFPLGLLASSLGFDAGYLSTGNAEFAIASFWMISAGILGGLLAALFGAIDWWGIPAGTRAKAIGLWHGGLNFIVLVLFAGAWWLRFNVPDHTPRPFAVTLSCIGIVLALVGGWLGGELVERLGIAVHVGAHPNAPSSLSGRPAFEQAEDTTAILPGPRNV